jgi:SAM-dependent methyltransferase
MFYTQFAEDYEKVFPFSQEVFRFLQDQLPPGARAVLDVGCATGHYAGAFAGAGLEAWGIDLDEAMIKSAKAAYPEARFRVRNLIDPGHFPRPFDLVYSTGNVMAHVDEEGLGRFLDHLEGLMSPAGVWFFQVMNWDYFVGPGEYIFPDKPAGDKIFRRRYSEITSEKLTFHTSLTDSGTGAVLFEDRVTLYPLKMETCRKIHEDRGFKMTGPFGDYNKSPLKTDRASPALYLFTRR